MSNYNDHDHVNVNVHDPVIIINKLTHIDENLIKRIKYKDIILSDSDSEFETKSRTGSDTNTYINSKVTLLKKNNKNKFVKKQFIKAKKKNKKSIIKIKKIKKNLCKFKNLVNKNISSANNQIENIRNGINSNLELLDRQNMFNKYFIKSIKFLEKNYLKYVEKQINKVDNYETDIYLELIYKIKFSYTVSEYESIINIYKNMKKELILDYEKILRHNNLILDQYPDDNLIYSINWFVIKVDSKYLITNKYFDNQIEYYSSLHFINRNIFNYALVIGLFAILVNFITKSNYNYNYSYKMVFDLDFVY